MTSKQGHWGYTVGTLTILLPVGDISGVKIRSSTLTNILRNLLRNMFIIKNDHILYLIDINRRVITRNVEILKSVRILTK